MRPIHLIVLLKYIYCYNIGSRVKFVKYFLLQYSYFHLTLFLLLLSSLSCEFFHNPLFYSERTIALTFLPTMLQELTAEIPMYLKTVMLIRL